MASPGKTRRTITPAAWRWIDWPLFLATLPILGAGLFTMNSFAPRNYFFDKQLIWIVLALIVFFVLALFDYHFLRRSSVITSLYVAAIGMLLLVFVFGSIAMEMTGSGNEMDSRTI